MILDQPPTYRTRTSAPQPHFDDKRTVLAARRVVPLSAVRRKSRLRGGFLLSMALLLSAFLGSGTALLSLYIQNIPITSTSAELASAPQQGVVSSEALQQGEIDSQPNFTSMNEPSANEPPEQTVSPDGRDVSRPLAVVRARRALALPTVSTATQGVVNQPDPPDSVRNHWEERRLRRVLRQAEVREVKPGKGNIFRIPEIFEGKHP